MKRSKKRKIYIILTYSGTFLAKVIRFYTKAEFCHVSISLDKKLKQMYSFGRLNPYNPLIGGLVREGQHFGTFKRFKKTKAAIYSLSLTEEQYLKIKKTIQEMFATKERYSFNIIGLFASGFQKRFQRENSFYCAEFIKFLVDKACINIELPEYIKPMDFTSLKQLKLEYRGDFQAYSGNNNIGEMKK